MLEPDRFRAALRCWAAGGPAAAEAGTLARDLARDRLNVVVFVEGVSDRAAVETLAARRELDLARTGVCVVPIGGAMSIGRYLALIGPAQVSAPTGLAATGSAAAGLAATGSAATGLAATVRGLGDEAEEEQFRRGLRRAGHGPDLSRTAMEALGFYICVVDLEDELIRALGVSGVERVLAAEKDLDRFRLFQNQPAQRGRPVERQLRRFFGTTSGRKAHYARLLVAALPLDRVPRPLDLLLASLDT